MRPLTITRAGLAGTVLAFAVAAVCARLGFWQLDRLEQRRARNAAVAERLAAPPVAPPVPGQDTAGLSYRRVALEGEWDEARSVVLAGRMLRGSPGVHLLTPLRLSGGGVVLVDRGWLPSPDAATVDPGRVREPGRVRVEGFLLPLPDAEPSVPVEVTDAGRGGGPVLYRLDGGALRRWLPYPVPAVYVQALPAEGAEGAGLPVRLDVPAPDAGPHLSYAFQWFAFAGIALVGWSVLAVRRGEVGWRGEGS